MPDIKKVNKALEILKQEKLQDLACFKNSTTTATLYDLHFANFDIIQEFVEEFGIFARALKEGIWVEYEGEFMFVAGEDLSIKYEAGEGYELVYAEKGLAFTKEEYKQYFWFRKGKSE